jgi:hypothetical protein
MIKAKIHPLYNYEIHMYLDDKLLGITWSNTYPEVGGVFEYKSDKLMITQVYKQDTSRFILDMRKV